jgi:cathepsin L
MRRHQPLAILGAVFLVVAFSWLSPVIGQQAHASSTQQPTDESQASIEAKEALRKLAAKKITYQVGYSPAMERKLTKLTGIEIPRGTVRQAQQVRREAQLRLAQEKQRLGQYYKEHPDELFDSIDVYELIRGELQKSHAGQPLPNDLPGLLPLLPTFNWYGMSGQVFAPVKDQGDCNSCWAFASLAAYQYSLRIQMTRVMGNRGRHIQDPSGNEVPVWVDAGMIQFLFSEQKLVNCTGKENGCGGGWHGSAFNYLVQYGAPMPSFDQGPPVNDYTGKDSACIGQEARTNNLKALTWDYVNYPPDKIPSVLQLKTALLEHGPLVVLVHVTDAFKAYRGGVFNERKRGEVNHAVTLIGWDDSNKAWLLQNSWGDNWGTKINLQGSDLGGFMWIAWNSNSVGKYAAWLDAKTGDD